MIFPIIVMIASPKIGFEWAIRLVAFVTAFLLIVANLLIRTRLPLNKKAGASVDFKSLADTKYALTTVAVWFIELANFIPNTYISSYALHVGIDQSTAYALIPMLNAGTVVGRFLPGLIADYYGRFNIMILTTLACGIITLALWYRAEDSLPAIISYALLFGFFSGTGIGLTFVCISQVCAIEDLGKRSGTAFTIASVASLVGIPIAGAIQQAGNGEYGWLIVFAGLAYVATSISFLIAKGYCCAWRLKTVF